MIQFICNVHAPIVRGELIYNPCGIVIKPNCYGFLNLSDELRLSLRGVASIHYQYMAARLRMMSNYARSRSFQVIHFEKHCHRAVDINATCTCTKWSTCMCLHWEIEYSYWQCQSWTGESIHAIRVLMKLWNTNLDLVDTEIWIFDTLCNCRSTFEIYRWSQNTSSLFAGTLYSTTEMLFWWNFHQ